MKIRAAGVAVALMVALWCAPADGILGGELDDGRHPSVGMMVGYDDTGFSFIACSGTFVAPTVFLTAAHCLVEPDMTEVRVTFEDPVARASDGFPEPATWVVASSWTPHPEYDDDLSGFISDEEISVDIGVVLLTEPATEVFADIQPVVIASLGHLDARPVVQQQFTLVGHGLSGLTKPARFAELNFDGYRRLAQVRGKVLIEPNQLGVRGNANSGHTRGVSRSGDSGGAVFQGSVLVGVISASHKYDSFAARLDTTFAMEFLAPYFD